MKRLYHHLVEHRWGDPADVFVFVPKSEGGFADVPLVHVAVWPADERCDVTTFATLGMSESFQPGRDYRVELTLGARARWAVHDRHAVASFLASVAGYPFHHSRAIDWWERLANPGRIPLFPSCTQVLFAPMFGDDPFESFPEPDAAVRILGVVPVTPQENHVLKEHGKRAFLDYWEENGVDIFEPGRFDPGAA